MTDQHHTLHPTIRSLLTTGPLPQGVEGSQLLVFFGDYEHADFYSWTTEQPDGPGWYDAWGKLKPEDTTRVRWLKLQDVGTEDTIAAQVHAATEAGLSWTASLKREEKDEAALTHAVSTAAAKLGLYLWGKQLRKQAESGPVVIPAGAPFPAAGVITHIGGQPLPTPVAVDAGDTCTAVVEAEAHVTEVPKLDVSHVVINGDYSMSVVGRAQEVVELGSLARAYDLGHGTATLKGEPVDFVRLTPAQVCVQTEALAALVGIARDYADHRTNDIVKALEVLGLPKDFGL